MNSGCPKDFPFSYYQGAYCCLTGYEKAGAGDDQSAWLDSCNGSKLSERGITIVKYRKRPLANMWVTA